MHRLMPRKTNTHLGAVDIQAAMGKKNGNNIHVAVATRKPQGGCTVSALRSHAHTQDLNPCAKDRSQKTWLLQTQPVQAAQVHTYFVFSWIGASVQQGLHNGHVAGRTRSQKRSLTPVLLQTHHRAGGHHRAAANVVHHRSCASAHLGSAEQRGDAVKARCCQHRADCVQVPSPDNSIPRVAQSHSRRTQPHAKNTKLAGCECGTNRDAIHWAGHWNADVTWEAWLTSPRTTAAPIGYALRGAGASRWWGAAGRVGPGSERQPQQRTRMHWDQMHPHSTGRTGHGCARVGAHSPLQRWARSRRSHLRDVGDNSTKG